MGLSASQARLLSITQRVNNNELKSEILANNKIRLAENGMKASEKYINALSAKKLEYNVYNKSGSKEKVALTFNALNNYNELQAQYGVLSATGQIYVTEKDAKNFEKYDSLYKFLEAYKLAKKNDDGVYEILDTNEAQWYTNLWYKMDAQDNIGMKFSNFCENGIKEMPDLDKIVKTNGAGNYLVIDDVLASSSNWLQFALENGLVTLTRIQVDTDPKGLNYWHSLEYTSTSDITETDAKAAMERAQVEYEQETKRIQAEDKKIDLDIKKLDTEHSALLKEYESIKNVIQKNAERSFTAFS